MKRQLLSIFLMTACCTAGTSFADNIDGQTGATIQHAKKNEKNSEAKAQEKVQKKKQEKGAEASENIVSADDESKKKENPQPRLRIGGYGEVALSRNFYSDNPSRYDLADKYKNAPDHGRFDIPHAVINLSYDFGKGWTFGTEIEFEHGGTGSAFEKEYEEGGEWESEIEKGGEVELEQFWIQKSFARYANVRAGHLVVPVGLNNSAHEPLNFFTVYRPEGENTLLPSTWHQTGISFWGEYKDFRYEAQLLAGLNADNFSTSNWINGGNAAPVEFEVATKYGASLRLDNYSVPGLRLGISGYYGHTQGNSFPSEETTYKFKGKLVVGSFDFTYDDHNWIVRGSADYGYLGDTDNLLYLYNRLNKKSPYHNTSRVSSNAYAVGVEAGYDVFSQIAKLRNEGHRLYVFGRYEAYNPCADSKTKKKYAHNDRQVMAFGVNYMPNDNIVVKAEYSKRMLKSQFNDEPSLNIGIAYQGWFN